VRLVLGPCRQGPDGAEGGRLEHDGPKRVRSSAPILIASPLVNEVAVVLVYGLSASRSPPLYAGVRAHSSPSPPA